MFIYFDYVLRHTSIADYNTFLNKKKTVFVPPLGFEPRFTD